MGSLRSLATLSRGLIFGCFLAGTACSEEKRGTAPSVSGGASSAGRVSSGGVPSGGAGGVGGSGGSGLAGGGGGKTGASGETSSGGTNSGGGMPSVGGAGTGGAGTGGAGTGGAAPADLIVYASGGGKIERFRYDPTQLTLTSLGSTNSGGATNYLAAHPSGRALYAVNELNGADTVRAFFIAPNTGALSAGNVKPSGGLGAVHVSVHPSGRWLLVSNYNGGNVSVFPLVATTHDLGDASDKIASAAESHQIVSDSSGKYVFVPCRGDNNIHQFSFDAGAGKLTPNAVATVSSADPRHLVFHPSGAAAFLVNENPANVTPLLYDSATGRFTAQSATTLANGENWGSHVEVTPRGEFVYVGGRRTNTIYGYRIAPNSFSLSAVGSFGQNINLPRDFTMTPDGAALIIANQGSGTLTILRIAADGKLTQAGAVVPTVANVASVVVVRVPR